MDADPAPPAPQRQRPEGTQTGTVGIARDFRNRVGAEIRLVKESEGRYRVSSPFRFDDGDHFVIILRREGDRWVLTDEAHTLMPLSHWADDLFEQPALAAVDRALASFGIERREGELTLPVSGGEYGKALYRFVQALIRVVDIVSLPSDRSGRER